jgi:hypothetical protein
VVEEWAEQSDTLGNTEYLLELMMWATTTTLSRFPEVTDSRQSRSYSGGGILLSFDGNKDRVALINSGEHCKISHTDPSLLDFERATCNSSKP